MSCSDRINQLKKPFMLTLPMLLIGQVSALTDYAKVVQVNSGVKTYMAQEYRCEEQVVLERGDRSNRDRAERALVAGALGYGLGHNSQHRDEIAGASAVAGWATTPKAEPKKRYKRICGNVMVPKTYPGGYEVIVEYKGEKKSIQSDVKYEVGDSFPIEVDWR